MPPGPVPGVREVTEEPFSAAPSPPSPLTEKLGVPTDGLADAVRELLGDVQRTLLAGAQTFRDERTGRATSYEAFKQLMDGRPGVRDCVLVRIGRLRSANQERDPGRHFTNDLLLDVHRHHIWSG